MTRTFSFYSKACFIDILSVDNFFSFTLIPPIFLNPNTCIFYATLAYSLIIIIQLEKGLTLLDTVRLNFQNEYQIERATGVILYKRFPMSKRMFNYEFIMCIKLCSERSAQCFMPSMFSQRVVKHFARVDLDDLNDSYSGDTARASGLMIFLLKLQLFSDI